MLVAEVKVFLQTLSNNVLQFRWRLGVEAEARNRTPVQDVVEDGSRRLTAERRSPGSHLIKRYCEGKQISACIQRLSQHLLRGHVGDCAQGGPWAGELVGVHRGRR